MKLSYINQFLLFLFNSVDDLKENTTYAGYS